MELLKRWPLVDHYLSNGAATIWILRYDLNLGKTWAYKQHKFLEISGFVEPKSTIAPVGRMKRTARIWGIPEATETQIKNAYQYHLKLISPIYRKADKIAKIYIQEGKPTKVSQSALIQYLKEINEPPRMRDDLAKMMLDIFSREVNVQIITDQETKEENLRRVLEVLPPPITQLTPLYEALTLLGIEDTESRDFIKNYYIAQMQREAK